MKKLIKAFLIIYLFFGFIGCVRAETYALNEKNKTSNEPVVPDNALVIGTHLITDTSKASTQLIMEATQTISGNDTIIYQKLLDANEDEEYSDKGWWINVLSEGDEAFPPNVNGLICITHIDGRAVDAECEATKFSVKFDGITGEQSEKTIYVKNGEKITAADVPTPETKRGKKFVCWMEQEKEETNEGKESCFKFDEVISRNVTLVPYYEDITYTIKFDINGGSTSNLADVTCTLEQITSNNEACKLPTVNATRKGYKFDGWSSVKDESGEEGTHYEAGKQMTDKLAEGKENEITLYAVWTPILYTITYNLDGGTYEDQAVVKSAYNILVKEGIELFTPTKKGHIFEGWEVLENDGNNKPTVSTTGDTDKKYTLDVADKTGDITLKAKWKEKEYTITYDLNLESTKVPVNAGVNNKVYATLLADKDLQAPANTTCSFATSCTLAEAPERDEYIFAGWADESGYLYAENKSYTGIDFGADKSEVKLKAQWNAKNEPLYDIEYNLDGGQFTTEAIDKYGRTTLETQLPTPVKTGYTFAGWCTDEQKSQCNNITTIKQALGDDVEELKELKLYAKWTANTYKVKFYEKSTALGINLQQLGVPDVEYKEIASSEKECTYDQECALTNHEKHFETKKEKLYGWSLSYGDKSNNNSIYLSDDLTVKNLTSTPNGEVKLYAVTEDLVYTITYYLDGGTFSAETDSHPDSATKDEQITIKNPTKDGYKFDKWIDKDGKDINEISEVEGQDSVKVTVKNDLFLVAVWTQKDPEMKVTNNDVNNAKKDQWTPVELKISPNNHNGIKAKIVVTITKDGDTEVTQDNVEARLNEESKLGSTSLPFTSTETAKTDEHGKMTLPTSSGFRLKAGSACELATINGACAEKGEDGFVTKKYDFKFSEAGTYKVKFEVFDYNYPEDGALSTTEVTITVDGQSS